MRYSSKVLTILTLISILGFSRSYFFASNEARGALPLAIHVHGLSLLGWGLLAIFQAQLVAARQIKLHRLFGWLSIVLVATAVASSYWVVRWSVAESLEPATRSRVLGFTLVQVTDLTLFMCFFAGAILCRRRKAEHLSFILVATVGLLPPALARLKAQWLHFIPGDPLTFAMVFIDLALLALCLNADSARRGSRLVFGACLAVEVAVQVTRHFASKTEAWLDVAEKLFVAG